LHGANSFTSNALAAVVSPPSKSAASRLFRISSGPFGLLINPGPGNARSPGRRP
jgi:hypothetical protein